ncbi:hypothetical protein MUK42_35078 [Musa troglodytarum]|uniref:Uncharacterized protein n=1 Tax=Musa troglodytarum TaxID=320322 RepID=A0A9E7EAS6_9LILI|nr:hypothetical protein MUK42_35078 [Musa troglodytarum]
MKLNVRAQQWTLRPWESETESFTVHQIPEVLDVSLPTKLCSLLSQLTTRGGGGGRALEVEKRGGGRNGIKSREKCNGEDAGADHLSLLSPSSALSLSLSLSFNICYEFFFFSYPFGPSAFPVFDRTELWREEQSRNISSLNLW